MSKAVVDRFREGLRAKRFTLTAVARATGIPLTTLAEMQNEAWGQRLFEALDRLTRIEQAMDELEGKPRDADPT